MLQTPLRVGVIGAGRIVERAHLPLLCARPDLAVVGLLDPHLARATTLANQFGIPFVCDRLEPLLETGLDMMLVACPNYLHAAMSIAALEAGLHVLCEKPMAISGAEAAAMRAAALATGRVLMIGFPNRFRPEVIALHRAVQQGLLGAIRSIRCGWLRRSGIPGAGTWFTNRAMAGGGALTDLGSHVLDLAFWLGAPGPLRNASCVLDMATGLLTPESWYTPSSAVESGISDVEIRASGFVAYSGPLDIFVEAGWASAVPFDQTYLQIHGTRGVALLETVFGFSPSGVRPEQPLRLWVDGLPVEQAPSPVVDLLQPYRDQLAFFVGSLRQGQGLHAQLDANVAMVETVEALYTAADDNALSR